MSIRYESPNKGSLFNVIKSRREAEKSIHLTTLVFLVLGGLGLLVTGISGDPVAIGLQLAIVASALWLRIGRDPVPAIVLIVISALDVLMRGLGLAMGGLVIIMHVAWFGVALIRLWLAVNAWRAAKFLREQPPEADKPAYKI